MAAAAALQRQQQKIVATSNANLNNSAPQNPAAMSVTMNGNIGRTSIATVPSTPSMVNTATNKPIIRQLAAKLSTQTKRAKPTLPSSKVASAQRPSASAKRAAFLNKRSKATGAAYRNPNKKTETTSNQR
mmetsp:Transcript_23445/g.51948  ORF Transcript_23445/g.51948 Transcript_23445/m.51948 type:complete len:130 (+) Transcript_23445:180-569(+)